MARISLFASISALLAIVLFYIWFPNSWLALGLYSALAVVSVIVSVVFYLVSGFARKEQHQALVAHEVAREQRLYQQVEHLAKGLADLDQTDSAKQAKRLMGMLEDYRGVIEQKLGDTTVTLSSYSHETARVFKLAINNLNDILAAAQSVYTTKQEKAEDDAVASEALQRRQALLTQQDARINELIEQNRELLTALNETTVQVANIKDTNSFELQESLERLRDLGERAQAFSKE